MHENIGSMHAGMGGPGEMRREVRIIHGEGPGMGGMGGMPGPGMGMHPERIPMSPEERERLNEFRKLINQYRQAKDDQEKEELKGTIRDRLAEQLESDLERREEQIGEMEKRIEKLRDQVKKAREGKEDTVEALVDRLDGASGPIGISLLGSTLWKVRRERCTNPWFRNALSGYG